MGDVSRGVMLDQSPIFLGGQGGLVGPVMLEYGTVVAAGTIVRKDILKKNRMLLGHTSFAKTIPFHMDLYSNLKRIIKLNTIYISNLISLRRWYLDVRSKFMGSNRMESALHKGAVEKIEMAIEERLKRLGEVAARMPVSIEIYQKSSGILSEKIILKKKEFHERWQEIEQAFKECYDMTGDPLDRDGFLEVIERSADRSNSDYIAAIKNLNEKESGMGVAWLQGIIDEIKRKAWSLLPSLELQ